MTPVAVHERLLNFSPINITAESIQWKIFSENRWHIFGWIFRMQLNQQAEGAQNRWLLQSFIWERRFQDPLKKCEWCKRMTTKEEAIIYCPDQFRYHNCLVLSWLILESRLMFK